MLYRILRPIANLIFRLLFRLEVKGQEFIPKIGGFILASNHASLLDPIVLGIASPRQLNFMARDDLFYNPLFSWLISILGAFPVKRNSPDLSALKEAMQRIKNGNVLVLFPEGRRQINGVCVSEAPRAGIGFLAAKLRCPVIPAFVKGSGRALPKGAKFIRPTKICVYFGKQIYIERRLPYQDIAKRIMEDIRHLSCQ